MEESHHHHHHHHHGHRTTHAESNSSKQQAEVASRTSEQQPIVTQTATAPVLVPRPNEEKSGGVQTTNSFHSVSSMDSSAEMATYFPDAQTPNLSPFSRHHQEGEAQQTQSVVTSTTEGVTKNAGPYATVPAPTGVQQRLPQPTRPPVTVPQQQVQPSGIPSYSSQIEGLSVSQAVVNDVIIDLQSKVINETQQQYYDGSSNGNYLEPLSPIYIRAPNPSIILRSDLHRLRAQLNARPSAAAPHPRNINQFQVPTFPPPQQHVRAEHYGEYRNTTYMNT